MPTPRAARFLVAVNAQLQWLNRSPILVGHDKMYGEDGQVPSYVWQQAVPRGRPFPIDLRTLTNNGVLYIGHDRIYGEDGQVPSYDYPNPRGRQFPIELRTYVFGNGQLYPFVAATPFNNLEWPVPKGHLYPIELRTFLLNDTGMIGQDQVYGAPGEVPDYDYPNPRGRVYPIELRTFVLNDTGVIGQDRIYGDPGQVPSYEWPVPKARAYPSILRTWTDQHLNDTLGIVLVPFFPILIDNPTGRKYPISLRTWTWTTVNFIGKDTMYGGQGEVPAYDWQLPNKSRPYPIALRTWTHTNVRFIGLDTMYGTFGQVPSYVWQTALPPRGRIRASTLGTYLQFAPINFFTVIQPVVGGGARRLLHGDGTNDVFLPNQRIFAPNRRVML